MLSNLILFIRICFVLNHQAKLEVLPIVRPIGCVGLGGLSSTSKFLLPGGLMGMNRWGGYLPLPPSTASCGDILQGKKSSIPVFWLFLKKEEENGELSSKSPVAARNRRDVRLFKQK